ncbi:SAV_2336 N-terminal domain-related protein [Streptomyces coacervatus]|uniref:SAV_2336 N-terminal domain-related protein n=1 Tax=Streptomyces coacervatus TaxID=647381 RepID=A0ABP7J240_9ACTN|nr:tetratricopeptide repeat protein [Streptomyces coacervatus]MDF2273175.1 tetratricopeptide repeat protein [Streptomyces coacervatus]
MSAQAPDTPAGDVSPELAALVARMRDAGIPPGVEELADALWLARWLPAPPEQARQVLSGTPEFAPPGGGGPEVSLPPGHSTSGVSTTDEGEQPDGARLFAPGAGAGGAAARMAPVRVPAAPALPEPLALQRGLRPLQRYRAPVRPVPRTLDERATAERAAETGLVLPVMRTDRRREARLLLLMDVSTSTVVWQQALDELRQVCERAGAFREVRVQYLHEGPGGLPGCSAAPGRTGPLHAPEQLSDPTGRRLTLVVSDCAGPMWRSGRMQQLLYRWAVTAPVAVVQPLPQRMWLRTHMPARRGLLHRREGPAGTLEFRPDKGRVEPAAVPVPVLALRRTSLEGWARLVSGARGQSLQGAAGWVRADHAAATVPARATEELTGEERVRAFWRPASREARRLAVYLSAVPLYLPVMQLVQHAMLAGTGPEVLSEVLLGGLLRRREDADDPQAVRYDFLPGVAPRLRDRLAVEEAELLFKHLSDYVERKFGRSVRNFPALAGAFLRGAVDPDAGATESSGTDADEPVGLRAFAEVSAEVLRDLGARMPAPPRRAGLNAWELLSKGREALGRFEAEGLTRELDAAVGYLRQALDVAGSGKEKTSAAEELANALLSRWRARGVGEDLRDAWEAVGELVALSSRGSLIRGTVCWIQAIEVGRIGLGFAGVADSLRDWAVIAAHGAYRPQDFALAVLLYVADVDLTTVLEDAGTAPDALGRRQQAAEQLMYVRRTIAEADAAPDEFGPFPVAAPEEWYLAHMHRAIDAAGVRISFPEPERGHLVRGLLWFEVAQEHERRGRETGRPRTKRVVDAAEHAISDLLVAVHDEGMLPAAERCRTWLTVASAAEILQPPRDDGRERRMMVSAVEEALQAAGEDESLLVDCHLWAARIYRERYTKTAEPEQLDRAVEAWTAALPLLGEDDPQRLEALTDLGGGLLVRFRATRSPDDANRAVQVLRTAVDETPPDDSGLAVRRHNLGLAHWARYEDQQILSDLYEAEWILGEAIHGSEEEPTQFLVRCWLDRGGVCLDLHARTREVAQLYSAINYYARALNIAQALGSAELMAQALMNRGRGLEALGSLGEARHHYRQALELTPDTDRSEFLRTALARLDSGTAPE